MNDTADHRETRVERVAPLAVGLLLALPVLVADYPPMTDLPLHEATVSLLRHFGDPARVPPGLYFLNLGHPNQLFHALAFLLSWAMPTEVACRVVVAGAVVGVPLGAARLASHIGASRWAALAVAPLALGWLFFTGLVANLLGLGCLLALLPTLDRFVARPTWRGARTTMGGVVLLYFAHEAMMFLFAAALLLFTLGAELRSRATWARLGVFAFAVLLTLAQLAYQAPLFTRSVSSIPTVFLPVHLKILGLPTVLFGTYDVFGARVVFALEVVTALLFVAQRIAAHRARGLPVPRTARAFVARYRFELFAACCAAAYLAYPVTLNGATFVYHRFLPPAFAVGMVALAPRRASEAPAPIGQRIVPLLAAALPLGALLVTWPAFVDASRNFRDVRALTSQIRMGSAVAAIAGNVPGTTHGFVRPTMGIRAVTDRGGRMLYSFSESPIAPVMIRREFQWPEPITRITEDENRLCPAHDLTRFSYLLFHTPDPRLAYLMTEALKPDARLVDTRGEWALYASTHDVVPLASPDVAAPKPCPGAMLGTRLERTAKALAATSANAAAR